MTAANEKTICPVCESRYALLNEIRAADWYFCDDCHAEWDESKRRAQPAEAVDDAKERKAFKRWYNFQSAVQHSPQADWAAEKAWLARARGGK